MATVLLALGLIAAIGSLLGYLIKGLDVDGARKIIGTLVLNVFLPALVFRVIYSAEIGKEFVQIPLTMILSMLICLGIAAAAFQPLKLQAEDKGALILASTFGNVTYLGLPLLQGLFPSLAVEVAKVAILSEVSTTPLNLSLGMALGTRFKAPPSPLQSVTRIGREAWKAVVSMPALWAIAIALIWKGTGLPVPGFLLQATQILGNTVTGLMMLALGMGLRYRRIHQPLPLLIASAIKLLISPLVVLGVALLIGLQAPYLEAVVLEGAMPTQLLTFVIADHVGLNSERLALCILINTAASFFTIPAMKALLFGG